MTELTPVSEWQVWLMDTAPKFSQLYSWLLMAFGFSVSILLARSLKNSGFYAVAVFFLSPVFFWGMREVRYQMHREAIEAYAAEQNRKIQSGEIIPHIESSVNFPLFETFLVLGLAVVYRNSKRRPIQLPEPTSGLAPGRGSS
ncbi:hypothetical protein AW736_24735 [Termitidicoccus mucosus]|uniref:Uncharacterized protein n=2 Tax=Termitidicoccus mucosus TaxID=1184151 RepID=A0A178IAS1_9BACT|nr:hypothetical protein AW736_24735 [Opitutaceae bacterium TSB47]